jgi:hypothetical protein
VTLIGVAGLLVAYDHRGSKGHPSAMTPADTTLHKPWLYFHPARDAAFAASMPDLIERSRHAISARRHSRAQHAQQRTPVHHAQRLVEQGGQRPVVVLDDRCRAHD